MLRILCFSNSDNKGNPLDDMQQVPGRASGKDVAYGRTIFLQKPLDEMPAGMMYYSTITVFRVFHFRMT